MQRRAFASSALLAGLAPIAGCLDDGEERAEGPDAGGDSDDEATLPIELETIDAPGSSAGTVAVPRAGELVVVNATRIRCPTSAALLGEIGVARERLSDVPFLSVLNATSGENASDRELADWWRGHDGAWTLAVDRRNVLLEYYDVERIPELLAIDGDGAVRWHDDGQPTASSIVAGVEAARDAGPTDA